MVAQALHVAEDTRSNMFFTVKDLSTGNCTAFVQTEQGISHPSNIGGLLEDQVVHKYSGVYKGSSRNLQEALLRSAEISSSNREILTRSGVKDLKTGKGSVIKVAKLAGLFCLGAASGVQVATMYENFSADGVVTAIEWAHLTREAMSGVFNPVGDAVGDMAKGGLEAAGEDPGFGEILIGIFAGLLGA